MKYLYKILRLFFCPHKYIQKEKHTVLKSNNNDIVGFFYIKECKYCGEIIQFNKYV